MKGISILGLWPAILLLAVVSAATADDVKYLRRLAEGNVAVIRVTGNDAEVTVGVSISGLGVVKRITDTHLVVERELSDEERADLESRGAAIHDVVQTSIPREDLRLVIGP